MHTYYIPLLAQRYTRQFTYPLINSFIKLHITHNLIYVSQADQAFAAPLRTLGIPPNARIYYGNQWVQIRCFELTLDLWTPTPFMARQNMHVMLLSVSKMIRHSHTKEISACLEERRHRWRREEAILQVLTSAYKEEPSWRRRSENVLVGNVSKRPITIGCYMSFAGIKIQCRMQSNSSADGQPDLVSVGPVVLTQDESRQATTIPDSWSPINPADMNSAPKQTDRVLLSALPAMPLVYP